MLHDLSPYNYNLIITLSMSLYHQLPIMLTGICNNGTSYRWKLLSQVGTSGMRDFASGVTTGLVVTFSALEK